MKYFTIVIYLIAALSLCDLLAARKSWKHGLSNRGGNRAGNRGGIQMNANKPYNLYGAALF